VSERATTTAAGGCREEEGKASEAKASRKRAGVKDLSAKKAAVVRGGLPAVQKVREAAARVAPEVPTDQISVNYGKIQF
jgi:hypothetical protein